MNIPRLLLELLVPFITVPMHLTLKLFPVIEIFWTLKVPAQYSVSEVTTELFAGFTQTAKATLRRIKKNRLRKIPFFRIFEINFFVNIRHKGKPALRFIFYSAFD